MGSFGRVDAAALGANVCLGVASRCKDLKIGSAVLITAADSAGATDGAAGVLTGTIVRYRVSFMPPQWL